MAKKWPGMVVQRSFIKGHSFQNSLYFELSYVFLVIQCNDSVDRENFFVFVCQKTIEDIEMKPKSI